MAVEKYLVGWGLVVVAAVYETVVGGRADERKKFVQRRNERKEIKIERNG